MEIDHLKCLVTLKINQIFVWPIIGLVATVLISDLRHTH